MGRADSIPLPHEHFALLDHEVGGLDLVACHFLAKLGFPLVESGVGLQQGHGQFHGRSGCVGSYLFGQVRLLVFHKGKCAIEIVESFQVFHPGFLVGIQVVENDAPLFRLGEQPIPIRHNALGKDAVQDREHGLLHGLRETTVHEGVKEGLIGRDIQDRKKTVAQSEDFLRGWIRRDCKLQCYDFLVKGVEEFSPLFPGKGKGLLDTIEEV